MTVFVEYCILKKIPIQRVNFSKEDKTMEFLSITMILIIILVYGLILLAGLASYIMTAWSIQSIGKQRGMHNNWLAWIPVASDWVLGKIADEYDGRNGIKRKWAKALLTLEIIFLVGFGVAYLLMIVMLVMMSLQMENSVSAEMTGSMFTIFVVVYAAMIVAVLPGCAFAACKMVCLYKVFESVVPKKSLKYFILSMIVPLAQPICLMLCRKKVMACCCEEVPVEEVLYEVETPEVVSQTDIN